MKLKELSAQLTPAQREIALEIQRLHQQGEPLNITAVKRRHPELLKAVYDLRPFWGWKRAIEAAGLVYRRLRVELQRYVTCRLCGAELQTLPKHLLAIHQIEADEYRREFPDSDLLCEAMRARMGNLAAARLQHWERCWTREYVLDRLAEVHAGTLTWTKSQLTEVKSELRYAAAAHCGSYRAALAAVGIRLVQFKKYADRAAVIAALTRRRATGLPLKARSLASGEHRDAALLRMAGKCFGSWPAALQAAGIAPAALVGPRSKYPDQASVIAEIQRRQAAREPLNMTALVAGKQRDGALYSQAQKRFGSWAAALLAAGLDPAERILKARRYPDNHSVLAEIGRRWAAGLPLKAFALEAGEHRDCALLANGQQRFGSWHAALKAAGLTPLEVGARSLKYPEPQMVIAEIRRRRAAGWPLNAAALARSNLRDNGLLRSGRVCFGSWTAALTAAGLAAADIVVSVPKYTDNQTVLAEIQRRQAAREPLNVAALIAGKQRDGALYGQARERFGSWQAALQAAGLDPAKIFLKPRRYTDDQSVLAEIRRRHAAGLPLNAGAVGKGAHCDFTLLEHGLKRFGSWNAALEAAGLDPGTIALRPPPKYVDQESVLAEIKRRHAAGLPLHVAAVNLGVHHDSALLNNANKQFGSWPAALKAAGLDPAVIVRRVRRYTDDGSVLAEIQRRHAAGLPLHAGALRLGEHRDSALLDNVWKRFGSLGAALWAAGLNPTKIVRSVRAR